MTVIKGRYHELLAQRAELDAAIAAAKGAEISKAIETCRELIEQFQLTPDMLFGKVRKAHFLKAKERRIVAPKYRDPATGATWTGRGRTPKWLGDKKDQFLISR